MRTLRWMAVADNHGDHAHPPAIQVALDFMADFKPQVRLHLGDAFDLRWLRKSASEQEQRESVLTDIAQGTDFLSRFKPTVWLRGNHDERLYDALDSDRGPMVMLASRLISDIETALPKNCAVLPYCKRNGIHRIGDTLFMHGYRGGMNSERDHARDYGANVVHGHVHRCSLGVANGLEPRYGYSCGCLCKLDLGYNRAQPNTLSQSHGFTYGFITDDRVTVYQARPVGGVWHLPTEFLEMSA